MASDASRFPYKNRAVLTGVLVQEPVLRVVEGADKAELRVKTVRRWRDPSGEWHSRDSFHDVWLWGERARAAADSLEPGPHGVHVEGELRNWKCEQGVYRTAVESRQVLFVADPLG